MWVIYQEANYPGKPTQRGHLPRRYEKRKDDCAGIARYVKDISPIGWGVVRQAPDNSYAHLRHPEIPGLTFLLHVEEN
jgi:hypothetical protein